MVSMTQEKDPLDNQKPRYQPPGLSGHNNDPLAGRPTDWPAPTAPGSGSTTGQGAWGNYTAGAPLSPNQTYGDNSNYNYTVPVQPPGYDLPLVDPAAQAQAEAYRRASKRVQARLDFYKHLTSYLIVNGFLWGIALLTSLGSGRFGWNTIWPIWITIFWGIGLASQWWNVFGDTEHRRQQMIEEELRKFRGR